MDNDQVNLIVEILQNDKNELSNLGLAKLILTKLKQLQTEKAEIAQKKQDEKSKIEAQMVMDGKMPFDCCYCYRPYYACICSTKN